MRFLLDENEIPAILDPLRLLYEDHVFDEAREIGLGGKEDVPLIHAAAREGYHALITRDKHQLSDRKEREALVETGLHWIGHREPDVGIAGIACLIAGYVSAFPHILEHLNGDPAVTAYHVRNVPRQVGQRVAIRPIRL